MKTLSDKLVDACSIDSFAVVDAEDVKEFIKDILERIGRDTKQCRWDCDYIKERAGPMLIELNNNGGENESIKRI